MNTTATENKLTLDEVLAGLDVILKVAEGNEYFDTLNMKLRLLDAEKFREWVSNREQVWQQRKAYRDEAEAQKQLVAELQQKYALQLGQEVEVEKRDSYRKGWKAQGTVTRVTKTLASVEVTLEDGTKKTLRFVRVPENINEYTRGKVPFASYKCRDDWETKYSSRFEYYYINGVRVAQ